MELFVSLLSEPRFAGWLDFPGLIRNPEMLNSNIKPMVVATKCVSKRINKHDFYFDKRLRDKKVFLSRIRFSRACGDVLNTWIYSI